MWSQPRGWWRWLLAVLVVALAAALRAGPLSAIGPRAPYVTFFPAVVIAALYGGLPAGLLASILSAVSALLFAGQPGHLVSLHHYADLPGLGVFLAGAIGISALCEGFLRAQARAARAEDAAKLTEQTARAQEALSRYDVLARNCRDIILCIRLSDARIVECNQAAVLAYGYTREELLSLEVHSLGIPDDRFITDRYMEGAGEGGVLYEATHRRKDGTAFPVEVSANSAMLGSDRVLLQVIRDLTARKKAEAARRDAEATVRAILDAATESILLFSADGVVLGANQTAARRMGRSLDDIIGRPLTELMAPSEAEAARARLQQAAESGLPQRFQERLDGVVLDQVLYPVPNGDGPADRVAVYSRDITEHIRVADEFQRLHASAQEEKDRLKALLDSMIDEVWFASPDGSFTLANPPAIREFGLEEPGLVDVATLAAGLEILREDGSPRPLSEAPPLRALSGEVVRNQEEIVSRPGSSEVRYRQVNASPVKDATGAIIGSVSVVRDVTDDKRAEEALRRKEAELTEAQRIAHIGSWYWDAASDTPSGTDELLRIFGLDPATETLPRWKDQRGLLFAPETWDGLQTRLAKVMQTGESTSFDLEGLRRGEPIWLMVRAEAIRDAGENVVGIRGTIQDISERKRAERELRRVNRTLEALRYSDQAILSAESEQSYLRDVCRIIVEDCGHAMVWIGYAEDGEDKAVRPVAAAGCDEGYLDGVAITWADTERGRGPTGTAIRTGRPCFCRDMQSDPQFLPWREEALKRGYASSIVLPLMADGRAFGAMTIYSTEQDPFTDDEVALLSQLAGDLSFGVGAIRMREANARAEQRLRNSERLYRAIGESIDYGVWVCEPDGRNIYASESFLKLVGQTQEQCSNFGWGDVLHPEDSERTIAAWKECVRTGGEWDIEHRYRGVDGEWHSILARGVPVRNENGELICWAGINLDISQLKQAEAETRASEARYRALFNTMIEGFALHEIICDEQGVPVDYRFLDINPAFEQLTGLRREDVIGRPVSEVVPGDDPMWVKRYGDVALTGTPARFTNYSPVLKRHYEVFAYRPAPHQFAVLFADVTERIASDTALRESEERMLTTLRSIGDAVVVTDAESRVSMMNPVAEVLIGWPEAEAMGRPVDDIVRLINEETLEPVPNPISRCLGENRVVGLADHTLLVGRDGRRLPIDDSAAPIRGADGAMLGAILVLRDISMRRRAEEELRRADRAKDEFLAMLSHELRNPLAVISNAATLIEINAADSQAVRRPVDALNRQVRHTARLVDDLLDVSRISHGKLELRCEVVDLGAVVQRAVDTARTSFSAFQHRLAVCLPEEPVWVLADSTRIEQVVDNLLSNAAKYTDPSGEITLALAVEDGRASIRVRDNGSGIEPAMLPRVFDLFAQGESSLDRSRGGLGIGLTLVRSLVELHGGSVEAHSDGPGCGSEFVVRLDLCEKGPIRATRAPETTVQRPRRIMVVDDNVEAAETLAEILSAWGHTVEFVHDGPAAIEMAARNRPEVVLLDIGLPGMDGYEVARSLRAIVDEPMLLIAITGYGQDEDRAQSRRAGFDDHLVKPVDFESLRTVLDRAAIYEA